MVRQLLRPGLCVYLREFIAEKAEVGAVADYSAVGDQLPPHTGKILNRRRFIEHCAEVIEVIEQQPPVREPGQRVVRREVDEILVGSLVGDVGADRRRPAQGAVAVGLDGDGLEHPEFGPRGRPHPQLAGPALTALEDRLGARGVAIGDATPEDLDAEWQRVKADEE